MPEGVIDGGQHAGSVANVGQRQAPTGPVPQLRVAAPRGGPKPDRQTQTFDVLIGQVQRLSATAMQTVGATAGTVSRSAVVGKPQGVADDDGRGRRPRPTQQTAQAARRTVRAPAKPSPAKPTSSIAHVEGSGAEIPAPT